MPNLTALLVLLLSLQSVSPAQDPPPLNAPEFAALRKRVPNKPLRSTEWTVTLPATARPGRVVPLPPPAQRSLAIPYKAERDPQLADDRLVVVAVDAAGDAVDWRIVPDPRVVRSEGPDATGRLSGTTLTYPEAELHVAIRETPAVRELRIYKPRWAGDQWVLEPVAASKVR